MPSLQEAEMTRVWASSGFSLYLADDLHLKEAFTHLEQGRILHNFVFIGAGSVRLLKGTITFVQAVGSC